MEYRGIVHHWMVPAYPNPPPTTGISLIKIILNASIIETLKKDAKVSPKGAKTLKTPPKTSPKPSPNPTKIGRKIQQKNASFGKSICFIIFSNFDLEIQKCALDFQCVLTSEVRSLA